MKNDTHSFIIRIWHETENGSQRIKSWRGSIDHVGKEKRFYFYGFDGIAPFIREQVGADTYNTKSTLQAIWRWLQKRIKKDLSENLE